MGFYGHITNTQRTSMTFDKIYPNRFTMDERANTDGIYAGRYVLVEYDRPADELLFQRVIQFDGFLYAPPPVRLDGQWSPENDDPSSPTSYLYKMEPLTIGTEMLTDISEDKKYVKSGVIVKCPAADNLGVVYNEDGDAIIRSISRTKYFTTGKINNAQRVTYNLLYNYKDKKFQLDAAESKDEKIGCYYEEKDYTDATLVDQIDKNYLINFNVDATRYSTARGYDSTVWQKTYANGQAKYVMIAELNSVVPVLDVTADAPTLAPMMPHFDKDSTNIYYKLHMQPTWGFRIKGANPEQLIPTLDYSGSVIQDASGKNVLATTDELEYPSDQKVQWMNTILENKDTTYNYVNQYLGENGWQKEPTDLAGAIYFNRLGFDKEFSTHSKDYPYTHRDLSTDPIVDGITLSPTGFSGHLYPTHTTQDETVVQPDVNELSVLLPSIGDTIADVWDLIYGNNLVNGTEDQKEHKRNLVIRWEDAKKVLAKEGLRLIDSDPDTFGLTYTPKEVNTLAGVINSVQDIMGMIITDDYSLEDESAASTLNEDYIYYDKNTKKFYYKKRAYTYEKVEGDIDYEKVELQNWEDYKGKSWWIDTNSMTPDYINEATFRPEREYIQGVNVPSTDKYARYFTTSDYEPGKFFVKKIYADETKLEPFRDATTLAEYHKYVKTKEVYDPAQTYWIVEPEAVKLKADAIYYVPNKYYAGYFILADKIIDEADFERRLKDGVRLFNGKTWASDYGYVLSDAEELHSGEYNKILEKDRVYYLTLKTCSLTEAEYLSRLANNAAPVLYAAKYFSQTNGVPQNYYVMSKKYELIPTDQHDIVSQSPGVYWYIEKEPGTSDSDYLEGNLLKNKYVGSDKLKQEFDVVINENCLYFREVVELVLSSATNVVDIASARRIVVEALPVGLYKYYKDPNTLEEGYKSVSALSSEIISATNYAEITDLYTLKVNILAIGYEANKYYYQVESGDYKDSVMIDNHLEPTPERKYWTVNMINKRTLTPEEIANKRQPNIEYYIYSEEDNDYILYTGELQVGKTYYISSLTDVPEIYFPNKYYYQNEQGEFILDLSPDFTEGREYYKNPQLYILKDPNGFYSEGANWPIAQNPPEDSGIELAKREDTWELAELKGFDISFNTLHGLILRLNKWMMQNDIHTRDEATLQGALNKLNDLIHRFGQMKPGQLMMVDDTGRMHGTNYTTAQEFSAINYGGYNDYEIETTEASAENEDMWIDIDTIDDYRDPRIIVKHNFTKVKDTTSTSDNNEDVSDTIDLYAPIVDNKGHVVGHNTETVTLPFGFKTIAAENTNETTATSDSIVLNNNIIADNTQDTLCIKANNKWIELLTQPNTDTLTIAHKTQTPDVPEVELFDLNTQESNKDVLPILASIEVDEASHVTSINHAQYTLPYGYKTITVTNTDENVDAPTIPVTLANVVADNTQDTVNFVANNQWIRLITDANSDTINFAHETHEISTTPVPNDLNTGREDARDTLSALGGIGYDKAGHISTISVWHYTLPFGYQTFKDENEGQSSAVNTHDTLTVKGDDWFKPVVTQGTLTYQHQNNNLYEGFIPTENYGLGNQTPKFGETFNVYSDALDINGHIINKTIETVTMPSSIEGLMITELPEETNDQYIYNNVTLHDTLMALSRGIVETGEYAQDLVVNLDLDYTEKWQATIFKTTNFEYTPATEEESHEATQEDVDAGLANAVGDKIIDVEAIEAETHTVEWLFTKVKELETLLKENSTT